MLQLISKTIYREIYRLYQRYLEEWVNKFFSQPLIPIRASIISGSNLTIISDIPDFSKGLVWDKESPFGEGATYIPRKYRKVPRSFI